MQRVLEPEVMDTWEESIEYDAMDFTSVNTAFAERAIELGPDIGLVLDAGTGPARIPILLGQRRSQWQIMGIDLSQTMLAVGQKNVDHAGLQTQITLEYADAKQLPYANQQFDMVISNSLIHHLPDPLPFLKELNRVLKPQGAILLRDLVRPADETTLHSLVQMIGIEYDDRQRQLFRDSLYAALTVEEISHLLNAAKLTNMTIYRSSELHWTAERASHSIN